MEKEFKEIKDAGIGSRGEINRKKGKGSSVLDIGV